tara:strand:+ start:6403 stop:7416 length:1014 start_codon:yes stop_codon:yes gene_type:complete
MNVEPQVTIGISTYKRREFLKECLQSILAQSFPYFEVIVGNNDSDNPLTVKELGLEDPRIRIINHEKNLGPIKNWNTQLAEAHGSFFCWLNDDDRFEIDFLDSLVKCHEEFPDIEVSYSRYHKSPKHDVGVIPKAYRLEQEEFLKRFIYDQVPIIGMYGCFKTESLRQLGGLLQLGKQQNSVGADHLLAVAVGSLGSVGCVDAALVYFRPHEASYSNTTGDLRAYRESYTDFLHCSESFLKDSFQESDSRYFQEGLVLLCCKHYCSVMRRSGIASWSEFALSMDLFKPWLRNLGSSSDVWNQFKTNVRSSLKRSTLTFRKEDDLIDSLRGRITALTI